MFLLPSRSAQSGLLHALVWVLLGVLVFTQPAHGLAGGRFVGLQTGLLAGSLGVFYLNVGWAVPRLLYRRRVLAYVGFLGLTVLAVGLAYGRLHELLRDPAAPPEGPRAADGRGPGPPYPRRFRHGRLPGSGWAAWLDPPVVFSTLLVLGLGTSVAAVQRGQREAALRQALEQEKLATELSWLKAQLNPHFFFNTLNNIYALTLLDGERAREALHRLSRMMRYVLYETPAGLAPLSQEVQFVRDYLDLMQLRLTPNVRVEFEAPEAPAPGALIAPLLLLTFVENAFKHGISALAPSYIRVALRQPTPQTLELRVRNSAFADRPTALDGHSGIGLANTRRRLALLYPGRHTLSITEDSPAHEYQVHLTLNLADAGPEAD